MKKTLLLLPAFLLTLHVTAQEETRDAEGLIADTILADTALADTAFADTLVVNSLPYPQNIIHRLDSMIAHSRTLQHSQLGLMVYDLTADSAIYVYNHRQTMRPASTMKLVTAITAIDRLGGSYQLRTSLYYKGHIADRKLTGDVYCVGGMDPRFDGDDLRAFVESICQLGVDTICGRLVADRTFKEPELLGEGWCWDDDNPVLSPLLLNRKDNLTERLVEKLRERGVVFSRYEVRGARYEDSSRYEVQGARDEDSSRDEVDVKYEESGKVPNGAVLLCTRTHTIEQVLTRMMKESDNLYAESMFFQLAAAGGARPAKASHARAAINRIIQKIGLAPSAYKVADGSGLSLYNYVSAELLTRLLRYAWRNKNISDCLMPTLPIAGFDGTLKNRMKGDYTCGNVRAKTGTLTGISSLAGYCTAANGHELCFTIINQGVLRTNDGRTFQDRVCRVLCGGKKD